MSVRVGIIAALVVSVFLMMQGISTTWKDRELPEIDLPQASDSSEVRGQLEPPVLQPNAPAAIPDLKSGYLFNEDRQLATPEEKGPEMPVTETEVGIEADIESLTYQGSIIAETFRRAIVSYTAPPEEPLAAAAAATTRRRPTLRRGRQARMPTRAAQGNVEQSQVEPGDLIAGYTVAAIFPDKIVFEKGGELLEKFIYDPSKERKAPVRSAEPRSAVPPRPMSTSVGAPSAPAPPPPVATSNTAGAAEASSARSSGITVSSPGSSSASSASAPAPVPQPPRQTTRRLIVSRKAPPKPDTSRVIRGGRRTTTTTPMPPGVHR